jgi:hypothetical protein
MIEDENRNDHDECDEQLIPQLILIILFILIIILLKTFYFDRNSRVTLVTP